jgi:hypothetical protein
MASPKGHAPYNKNGEGGRPKIYTKEVIEKFADELEIWLEDEENYWFNKFCHQKKIHPKKMSEWAAENERFREVLELARSIQEERVFSGSMINKYNSNMSKMHLTNHHGWCDKSETKISGDAANPLAFAMHMIDNDTKDLVDE